MNINFSLSLMAGAIFFFVMFIVFSLPNYKARFNLNYSFRNTFPYELNYKGRFADNLIGNICLIVATLCLIVFFSTFNKYYNNVFFIACFISGVIVAVGSLLVMFIPFELLKFHLVLDLVMFVGVLFCNGILATGSFFAYYDSPKPLFIVVGVISVIFVLIVFVLIMNPKLSHWADLSPVKNEDGTASFKRPKYFVLAYSEWILVLLTFLSTLPVYILMYTF